MAKLTEYQLSTLCDIQDGKVMLRGRIDRYWWADTGKLCSPVARGLMLKGLIQTVYVNSTREKVEITEAGRMALLSGVSKEE
ncbi:hypothetical protein [Citrobacter freundii]|nr:hypothetical protein [Citrobacter freundii]MBA7790796.1 hypothetical protein [Citrobacter freundii]HBV7425863.1 hypothetical protein [Citrobacter freundii]